MTDGIWGEPIFGLTVTGCVEIDKHGPYRSEKAFRRAALRLHQKQDPATDALF